MKTSLKTILSTLSAFCLSTSAAIADGAGALYSPSGDVYISEAMIQGDVTVDGKTFSTWWFTQLNMLAYIPQEAIYVSMDANNPIIGKTFEGGWLVKGSPAALGARACSESAKDHNGDQHPVWGKLEWTVTQLGQNYDFALALSQCDGPFQPFGVGRF